MIGKTLGHYEILRSLGRGGMGEVYLARDTRLGREVAVKLLPDDLKSDPGRRARFEREAQAVAALNHPHVVILHAVEEAEDQPFLVMEFVDGKTLDEVIGSEGLPLGRFFDLALALTEAVAAAHARGITHRDLKPRNVMIDREGRLKVLDFGLAKLLEEPAAADDDETIAAVTREGVIVGTAAYMSPEQAEGKPVDSRSDVFSLGILLYQMVTGQKPFAGETHMSTLTAVLRDDPRPVIEMRPELPRQMARIIRRCLEKMPDRRYESARGVHYDLQILREEMDSGEHEKPVIPTAAPHRRPRARMRHLVPWVAVGAAIALVAAGTVWMQSRDGDEPVTVAHVAERSAAEPTIAVFPFENLGPPEDAYFAAGVTDEIIASLTGIDGVRVLSRSSSQQYDRTGKSMQQIAADLGVDYVLEGSVRWQRNDDGTSRVRVTPQLMGAATDAQLWAGRYDRAMEEIFTVQSEIATEVVRSLGVTLAVGASTGAAAEAPTDDLTAYHAYLRGKQHMDLARFDASTWLLAVDVLEKAVERDPEFHAAWVQLAKANAGLCHFNWDRTEERLARSKVAVDRARALRPDHALTHYAHGIYYYWGLKDYERAYASFERSAELNPDNTETLEGMAYVLRRQENYAEAAEILIELSERVPQNAPLAMHVAETLALVERYDEALVWSDRSVEYGPDQPASYTMGAWISVQGGQHDRARLYLADVPTYTDPEVESHFFRSYIEMRDYAEALATAAALPELLLTQYHTTSRHLATAMAYRAMDRLDPAREAFARAEVVLAAAVKDHPEAGNTRAAHALALAGLGRHDEARAELERSFQLYPASKDPWIMTWRLWDQAYIQMLAGEFEAVVATLADLMSRQTDVISPPMLRNSPFWDELRGRDDFQALLAELS